MTKLYTLLFCLNSIVVFSQMDTVVLNVDILGESYPLSTYHHPIDGFYLIKANKPFELTKQQQKVLSVFAHINPTAKHFNKKNYVQANSLRHYIEPNDLIYINWGIGSDTSNYEKLNQFIVDSKKLRQAKYQTLVQNYFKDFYIKKTEVTNLEYHQFTNWVKDSIFMEAIFLQYPNFEQAKQVLNIPKSTIITDTTDRQKIRTQFNLNFECDYLNKKKFNQLKIVEILLPFYVKRDGTWYKFSPLNINLLNYSYNSNTLNVYPDTLAWSNQFPLLFNDPMTNMYFWHPAYNSYPVVGVSKQQAEAYCFWKTQQLKNAMLHLDFPFTITAVLPSTMDYENTIRQNVSPFYEKDIEDTELITNLQLTEDNTIKPKKSFNHTSYIYEPLLTNKVYIPSAYPQTKKELKIINKSIKKYYNYNSYEEVKLLRQRILENYVEQNIYFLSNNVSEWMSENYEDNYKNLIKAYINYNCFASIEYCEGQKIVDEKLIRKNDKLGSLIYGGNWFDERYGSYYGINKAGLYPKKFKDSTKQFSTVGFRYVLRLEEN